MGDGAIDATKDATQSYSASTHDFGSGSAAKIIRSTRKAHVERPFPRVLLIDVLLNSMRGVHCRLGHFRPTCYSLVLLGFWEGRKQLSAAKTLRERAPSQQT